MESRHLVLNPNPIVYEQRGNAWFRVNSTTPKYTHKQMSKAPSWAQLCAVSWAFETFLP